MSIDRVRIEWTGMPGQPGVSTLYFNDAASALGSVRDFCAVLSNYIPNNVHLQVVSTGDRLNSVTGVLEGTWLGDAQAVVDGAGGALYAGPVGIQIQWLTAAVHNGRHVRGRTYVVPCNNALFDSDGTPDNTKTVGLVNGGVALVGANVGNFLVWSRPRDAVPAWTGPDGRAHKAKPAVDGFTAPVIGGRVPDKAIVLRTRRD